MSTRPRTVSSRLGGRRGLLFLAALATTIAGIVVLVIALRSQESAPQPTAAARGRISVPATVARPSAGIASSGTASSGSGASQSPTHPEGSSSTTGPLTLTASRPTFIDIAAIGVRSSVISVGKNPDGTLAVPQPGPNLNKVAWFRGSPTPGQAGPTVLEGHVDTLQGPSIFFRLGALVPGDKVEITRADHTTAVFTVNAVRSYASHADFPQTQIFGADLSVPTLRLITCSNFDQTIGHYVGNTVVFAHLTAVQPG